MGRLRIHLLLADNDWSTRYNIPKNPCYSNSSTDWTPISLYLTVENFGIQMIRDEMDATVMDKSLYKIEITHTVY